MSMLDLTHPLLNFKKFGFFLADIPYILLYIIGVYVPI